MTKIFLFIKRFWILILIILAIILYTISLFLKEKPSSTTSLTNPPSATIEPFKSIVPGTSTEEQVSTELGRPIVSTTSGQMKISEYKSTNQYRFHEVIFTNGKASLIKEIVNSTDNKEVGSVKNILGEPRYLLYNKIPNDFNLYTYPENGVAYVAHPDGTLLEVWYFQPTSIDNLLNTWATNYSMDKPIDNSLY